MFLFFQSPTWLVKSKFPQTSKKWQMTQMPFAEIFGLCWNFLTPDTWHLTHRTWWRLTQHLKSLALTIWRWRCFEDIFKKDETVSVLIIFNLDLHRSKFGRKWDKFGRKYIKKSELCGVLGVLKPLLWQYFLCMVLCTVHCTLKLNTLFLYYLKEHI